MSDTLRTRWPCTVRAICRAGGLIRTMKVWKRIKEFNKAT